MQSFLARWMPIDASSHGAPLDRMNAMVHWLMLVLFVGWGLYFLYVLYRFRASANPKASHEGAKSHFSSYIEAGVAIVEVILLVGFAIPAWASWVSPETSDPEPFVVRVVAQQFQWNVHYPGPDGVFGPTDVSLLSNTNFVGLDRADPAAADDVVMINQMPLPVDRDITVMLSSKDVIHGFFLPQMRVKQDAVPGLAIPVRFRAVTATPADGLFPGCFQTKTCWEIACAQLCGLTHYRMQGYYTIQSQDSFDAWMDEQQALLQPAQPAQPAQATDEAQADSSAAAAGGTEADEHADASQ